MKVKFKVEDLKVGMFVDLPYSWFTKIFTESEYLLESQEQIDLIKSKGISYVLVDLAKSQIAAPTKNITLVAANNKKILIKTAPPVILPKESSVPIIDNSVPAWFNQQFSAEHLQETLSATGIAPQDKAGLIYKDTVLLVNQMLNDPTAANLIEGKKNISLIVDFILKDDVASNYLISITSHDYYTYAHSVNVGILSVMLSKELFKRSDAHNMHEMGAGFFLHDIGKTQISKELINSPDKLNKEQISQIRQHPLLGYNILKQTSQLTDEAKYIVLEHHERNDGNGYPLKLSGEEIHLYGRICSIADVYDALTAQRSYKPAYTPFESLKIMKTEMLAHFNQELFSKFVLLFSR